MYAYIKGIVSEITKNSVIIENNGIGYEILLSEKDLKNLEKKSEIKIYTYYHVTQENIQLFGFLNEEDKKMFLHLISVSKIGAKTAIGMLADVSATEIALAIITDDINKLASLPGIGKKTAQRIILEVKDKLDTEDAILQRMQGEENEIIDRKNKEKQKLTDITDALNILGYTNKQVMEILPQLNLEESTEDLIKAALKLLN